MPRFWWRRVVVGRTRACFVICEFIQKQTLVAPCLGHDTRFDHDDGGFSWSHPRELLSLRRSGRSCSTRTADSGVLISSTMEPTECKYRINPALYVPICSIPIATMRPCPYVYAVSAMQPAAVLENPDWLCTFRAQLRLRLSCLYIGGYRPYIHTAGAVAIAGCCCLVGALVVTSASLTPWSGVRE